MEFTGRGVKITGNLKTNLRRICFKMEEYEKEHGEVAQGRGAFAITDMVRATLNVKSATEMETAYGVLSQMKGLQIVRVDNRITDPIQNVTLNVIYYDMIIGEIQLRFGLLPVNYYGNHFLRELLRCDSAAQFRQQVMAQLNYLAQHDGIYTPKIDETRYNDRRHEIARNLQTEIKEVELAAWRAEHYDLMRRDADYERWGRREMVRLGIPEEDWADYWRQHREHLKLLKDDGDYRTWGVTWME